MRVSGRNEEVVDQLYAFADSVACHRVRVGARGIHTFGVRGRARAVLNKDFKKTATVVWTVLGIILSSLSIFLLIHQGIEFSLSRPFLVITAYYEAFIQVVLKPFEPYVLYAATYISEVLRINIEVQPHWRHAFIVMVVYFLVDFRTYVIRRYFATSVVTFSVALVLATVASVGSGHFDLNDPGMRSVILPIAAFFLYEVMKAPWSATFIRRPDTSWLYTFGYYTVLYGLLNMLIGVVVVGGIALFGKAGAPGYNVGAFVLFLLLVSARNFIIAGTNVSRFRKAGDTWWRTCFRSGSGMHARDLTASIGASFLFIASNAGLRFFGL